MVRRFGVAALVLMLLALAVTWPGSAEEIRINPYVVETDAAFTLSDPAKTAYRALVDAALTHAGSVRLADSYDDNLTALWLWQNNPYSFLTTAVRFSEDHRTIYLEYLYPSEKQAEAIQYINGEYAGLLADIADQDMSEIEAALAVHHYFARRISYDYAYQEALGASDQKYLYPEINIYEALITGKGVCHSYAAACAFAYQQLGIDCVRLTAELENGEENHMWLAVRLEGEWYHIDPTWDSDGEWVSLQCFGTTDEERLERGITDTWNVEVDVNFGPIQCLSERFSSLHDVYDYTMLGNHQMLVYRLGEEAPDIIGIDSL